MEADNLTVREDDGQSDVETQDAMAEFDLLPISVLILMVIIQFGIVLLLNVVQYGVILTERNSNLDDQIEESPAFVIYESLRLLRVLTKAMTIFALLMSRMEMLAVPGDN